MRRGGLTPRALLVAVVGVVMSGALGSPAGAEVDPDGPDLLSMGVPAPTTVDVSGGWATFTVDLHITDASAGLDVGSLSFVSPPLPDGRHQHAFSTFGATRLVSGTTQDGVWRVPVDVPGYVKAGPWCLESVSLHDLGGHVSTYADAALADLAVCVEVVSTNEDVDVPVLESLSPATPGTVDVTDGPATLTVDAHITDAPAGLSQATVWFSPPPGASSPTAYPAGWAGGRGVLSGTAQDGVWRISVEVPQRAPGGSWCLSRASLIDGADNRRTYEGSALSPFATCVEVNTRPSASDQAYAIRESRPVPILLSASDPDGEALSYAVSSEPVHGTLTGSAGTTLSYTPHPGFVGADSFEFTATDGHGGSDTATVTINVTPNQVPVAADDAYATAEDTPLSVAPWGVLANDSDGDGMPTAEIAEEPTHGTVELAPDGGFTYLPDRDFHGTDTFTYTANDDLASSAPAAVTVDVAPVNDAPVVVGDAYSTDEDTPLTAASPGVAGNDADPDGDALTVELVDPPSHGTLMLDVDGSFTYMPAADYAGPDSFTYTASDGELTSVPVTVDLVVVEAPRTATRVTAAPATLRALPGLQVHLGFTATLVDVDGAPLPNRTVVFTAPLGVRCEAITDAAGVARCELTAPSLVATLVNLGYDATFAGDADHLAATGHGPLIEVGTAAATTSQGLESLRAR